LLIDDDCRREICENVDVRYRSAGRKFCTNVENVSLSRRWDFRAIVSNTSDDFPEPETPVKTVMLHRGCRRDVLEVVLRAPGPGWCRAIRFGRWAGKLVESALRIPAERGFGVPPSSESDRFGTIQVRGARENNLKTSP